MSLFVSRSVWLLIALTLVSVKAASDESASTFTQSLDLSNSTGLSEPTSGPESTDAPVTAIPIAVFSTYPSAAMLGSCESEGPHSECIEDSISPDAFVSILTSQSWFTDVKPYDNGVDYELLIANVANQNEEKLTNTENHFTELTLQWRGIEIDSRVIQTHVNRSAEARQKALEPLILWYKQATDQAIFSPTFLYKAVNASDYDNYLSVPESLGDFTRLDTQLYPDPFKGSITRYTHPAYEDALVDVTVYPILAKLDGNTANNGLPRKAVSSKKAFNEQASADVYSLENSETTDAILHQQLDEDWIKADKVAHSRNLTLTQPQPVSPFVVQGFANGWRLSLKADSPVDDAIFATTYVFKYNDKIVKVATTFPSDFSDPLANELVAHISVPDESVLMQQVRAMLK
ncbi:hypothetical protein Q4561_04165 [Alteromonas sp. 1_MG-2023]|uniref:hypothetical protein n=1 Tax=Alteromonas sp. 1_MG-2023 TaxID=3062669 RepID=UPI0026E17707|nr:hypothetical protein [Alteromonas sp. 1_MG-2023]MDO6566240.1 hypothetical protein [Alteromonas sp. 1_MG-2023]